MTVLTGEYLEIYGTKVKSEDTRGHGLSGLEEIQTLVDGPNPRDQNMGGGGDIPYKVVYHCWEYT